MEEKIYYILTDTYVHECIGKESLKKKVNALQVLGIDFEVFQKVDGEERKVLVGINDFLKVLGV